MKEIFRVTAKELSTYILLYLIVISAALIRVTNIDQESIDQNIFSGTVALFERSLEAVNNQIALNTTMNTVLLALFWAIVGSFCYFVIWYIINILVNLKNDLKISASFVHPKSFHQSEFWLSNLMYLVSKIAATTIAVALIVTSIIHTIPVVSELFYRSLSVNNYGLVIASFILVLIVVFIVGHFINILIRYSFYS